MQNFDGATDNNLACNQQPTCMCQAHNLRYYVGVIGFHSKLRVHVGLVAF